MKTVYKHKIMYCPKIWESPNYQIIEKWLDDLALEGWELLAIRPGSVSSGYTQNSPAYIFRKKITQCMPNEISEDSKV